MSDAYQLNNGARWCWCSAKQAAHAFGQYPVRLVGPPSTDAPVHHNWSIQYGPDGVACGMKWNQERSEA